MITERDKAWRGTAVACALSVIGMLLDLLIARAVPAVSLWPNLVAIGFAIGLLVAIALGLRGPRFAEGSFIALNLVLVAALWITDAQYSTAVSSWVAFRPHHLGIMAVAILAPSPWPSGAVSITVLVGAAIAELVTLPSAVRAHQLGEPWITIIYGVFGLVLLVYRAQRAEAELARARAMSQSQAMQQLARRFLALRDLANTPLQTLSLSASLLREGHPELAPILDRIERAIEQLRRGTRLMAQYDAYLPWDARATSFDPMRILQPIGPSDDHDKPKQGP